jgi:TRAP-type mannitol/chloroaromatic compound transport system permease large subunit
VAVPEWVQRLERGPARRIAGSLLAALVRPGLVRGATTPDGQPVGYGLLVKSVLALLVPLVLSAVTLGATWWYVVIYNAPVVSAAAPVVVRPPATAPAPVGAAPVPAEPDQPQELGAATAPAAEAPPQELGAAETTVESSEPVTVPDAPPQEMGSPAAPSAGSATGQMPAYFYAWFGGFAVLAALLLGVYYWRMDGEQLEILKELVVAVVPLGVLTIVVLAVILFGITTATESAAVGALGALYLAVMAKYPRQVWWCTLAGAIVGLALGWRRGDVATLAVSATLGGVFVGTAIPWAWSLRVSRELWVNLKESVFLTAKTSAMVCWLFVGSSIFSAAFALLGGQEIINTWVLSMDMTPVQFMILAQVVIFLLGWPLEWTEIIVIFMPIFIPLLPHFGIDPLFFGLLVALNLQTAFLSPPVAMAAFYLKGVSPPHVTLNQIFAGMLPFMAIQVFAIILLYQFPAIGLWLPQLLYK